jgi:hypothetical protein
LEHEFYFPYIGHVIIPTDFHSIIFQDGFFHHQAVKYLFLWISYGLIWDALTTLLGYLWGTILSFKITKLGRFFMALKMWEFATLL